MTPKRVLSGVLALGVAALLLLWALGRSPVSLPDGAVREDAPRGSVDGFRDPLLTGAQKVPEDATEDEDEASTPEEDDSPVLQEMVARDARTGDPLPHFAVRMETSEVSGLGTLHLVADGQGRLEVPRSRVTEVASETAGWTAAPIDLRDGYLLFHAWFEIHGDVAWDGADPPDLSEVSVRVSGGGPKVEVEGPDGDGRFRIRLPLLGDAAPVVASHPDAWAARVLVEPPEVPGRAVTTRIVLHPRVRPVLEGRVVDRAGRPMPDVLLHAHVPRTDLATDSGHITRIRGPDGRMRRVLRETPFLPATGRTSGSARLPHRWLAASTHSDAEGRYRFSLPEPGPVELTAFATGHAPVRLDPREVRADGAEIDIRVHRPVSNASQLTFTREGTRVAPARVRVFELIGSAENGYVARRGLTYEIAEDAAILVDTTWLEAGRHYRFVVAYAFREEKGQRSTRGGRIEEYVQRRPTKEATVEVEWANQAEIAIE